MEQLRAGIELIVKQMEEVLRSLNVTQWKRLERASIPASTKRSRVSIAPIFPITRSWMRFAADTASATGCFVLLLSVS